jgi:hypothetical protein
MQLGIAQLFDGRTRDDNNNIDDHKVTCHRMFEPVLTLPKSKCRTRIGAGLLGG